MNYQQLIAWAKSRLSEAKDEVAAEIVVYLDAHPSQSLQAMCKEIDPDDWNALRQRAQKLQKARSEGVPTRSPRDRDMEAVARLKSDPARRADLEDEIAKDMATVARINEKARQLRPEPRPIQPDRANVFDMSALRAAGVQQRKAIERMMELVHDRKISIDDLSEEVDYIKVNLAMLTAASTDFDGELANILNGEA